MTQNAAANIISTRTRDGITEETRLEFGSAARLNRARHAGQKVHKLVATYIVAVEEGAEVRPRTFAAEFIRTGRPVLTSCHPICGCTNGQFAGRPTPGLTEADVTCSKCA